MFPSPGRAWSRRDILRAGSLSFAASALPAHLDAAAGAARADAVIFLWMAGGVTHIDSFDPKPDAPAEIRGKLGVIPTTLPGVQFCETMPRLARVAHELALVRSYSHDSDDHLLSQVYTLSGHKVAMSDLYTHPNIGSLVAHLNGPRGGLPGYIAVPGTTRPGPPPYNFFRGGWLGAHHAPYCLGGVPAEPDFTVSEKLDNPTSQVDENLQPQSLAAPLELTGDRLDRRAGLREGFDTLLRRLDRQPEVAAQDAGFESALRLARNARIRDAFDLDRERPAVRENYGRTKLGGRCLLARRLVEAGARFVIVDYGYDSDYGNIWDNHNAPTQNHPPIQDMVRRGYHLAGMDRAFAALLTDLKARGMLGRTLVVYLTEFGRTPKINSNGGRDHWGAAGSMFFAGGGARTGQVIGATNKHAAEPTTRPITPADIAATLYSALGIAPHTIVKDFQGRPRPILERGEVIREVLG